MVLDSVQSVGTAEADGSPGGVSQVREVTGALVRVAKRRGMAVIIVGHVTKDGSIAGPRMMEHLVDVVLSFEGDRHSGLRLVRATKNRFGPADEVGCFEMAEQGIVEVPDPSGLFTSRHIEPVPGTCVTVTMEGRRPLLAELQALVAPTSIPQPRRTTHGVDAGRLAMVLAVLERRCGVKLYNCDVYVSTVGGAKVSDPSADLAAALAVASAAYDRSLSPRVIALGEIGLAGELRRVPGIDRRLAEAARLGFTEAVVPAEAEHARPPADGPQRDAGARGADLGSGTGRAGYGVGPPPRPSRQPGAERPGGALQPAAPLGSERGPPARTDCARRGDRSGVG